MAASPRSLGFWLPLKGFRACTMGSASWGRPCSTSSQMSSSWQPRFRSAGMSEASAWWSRPSASLYRFWLRASSARRVFASPMKGDFGHCRSSFFSATAAAGRLPTRASRMPWA